MANITSLIGLATTGLGVVGNLTGGLGSKKAKGGTSHFIENATKSEFLRYGIQRDNLAYIVHFSPKVLIDRYKVDKMMRMCALRQEGFNIPGPSIQTSDIRRYGVGNITRVPVGNVNSSNITVTMLGDQHGFLYNYYWAWIDSIVRFRRGKSDSFNKASDWGVYPYEVSYFSDYAIDLATFEMDETFEDISGMRFTGAYPISISDKSFNWGNSGLVTFTVEFTYETIDIEKFKLEQKPYPKKKSSTSLLGSLMKAGNALQTLSALRKPRGIGDLINVVGAGAAATGAIGGISR